MIFNKKYILQSPLLAVEKKSILIFH